MCCDSKREKITGILVVFSSEFSFIHHSSSKQENLVKAFASVTVMTSSWKPLKKTEEDLLLLIRLCCHGKREYIFYAWHEKFCRVNKENELALVRFWEKKALKPP